MIFRRDRPPHEVLTGLEADERLLTWATARDGAVLLATSRGLWLPEPGEPERRARLPWHRVDQVIWRDGVLAVVEAVELGDSVVEERPPRAFPLESPRRLPYVVRQRVEASIGYTRHHDLVPSGGVRVVARRVSGRDGLTWYLLFDAGTDRDDPQVMGQAQEALTLARATTGL